VRKTSKQRTFLTPMLSDRKCPTMKEREESSSEECSHL